MPRNLYGARAKYVWAHEKLRTLATEVRRYEQDNPHTVTVEQDRPTTRMTFVLNVPNEMPLLRWRLLVGDCIQGFRSSLDHAIVELAARKTGSWPLPPKRERDLQFPICDDPVRFEKFLWRLGDLRNDEAIRRRIEGLQPYNREPPTYRPLLAILRDLNDQDKHRFISVVRSHLRQMDFTISNGASEDIYCLPVFPDVPLVDGARFMEFLFVRPERDVSMQGSHTFAFYPAIQFPVLRETHARGEFDIPEMVPLLRALARETRYCLTGLNLLT